MLKSFFKPKVQPAKNKLTFNHISFITSIDEYGNIKIESFDCPFIKIKDEGVIFPSFWPTDKFIDTFKLFGSSKLNDSEVNLVNKLIQRLFSYKKETNIKKVFELWLFESTERFIQRKQILELLLDKTIYYIEEKKSFYESITKEPDIELKLSDQEYEELKRHLFGIP